MEFTKKEIARFEAKVAKLDEQSCWVWMGPKFEVGYGMFCVSRRHGQRRTFAAHRISLMMHTGLEIPKGMFVCHTCDNRICVNPHHLYVGTPRDNNLDTIRRGRGNRTVGSACSWSKVTEEQVLEILASKYGRGECTALAKKFGVSQSQISHIRHGRRWPHMKESLLND